jgi:hypothetical protein
MLGDFGFDSGFEEGTSGPVASEPVVKATTVRATTSSF